MSAVLRVLLRDAVDAQLQPLGLRVAELVGGDDDRPHRAEAVEALALEPLHVLLLQVARGDVVDDRVAEHVLERVGLRDVAAGRADDRRRAPLPSPPAA